MYQNETVSEYLNYVKSQLETIDRREAVASYDTGYGLHVVSTQLGDSCHCLDVLQHSVLKIRTPRVEGEAWYKAWEEGCLIVRQFCNKNITDRQWITMHLF